MLDTSVLMHAEFISSSGKLPRSFCFGRASNPARDYRRISNPEIRAEGECAKKCATDRRLPGEFELGLSFSGIGGVAAARAPASSSNMEG